MPITENINYYHIPLTGFFEVLEQNGFGFGVDTYELAHFVIRKRLEAQEPDKKEIKDLDLWLCPIIAKTAEEQHLFYELYQRFFPSSTEKLDEIESSEKDKQAEKPTTEEKSLQPTSETQPAKTKEKEKEKAPVETKVVASIVSRNIKPVYIEHFIDDTTIEPDSGLLKTVRQMRFNKPLGRRVLDVPKTIKKAINNKGYTSPEWSFPKRHVEYLMLIDQSSLTDHRAEWQNKIFQLLLNNNITVERYYFDTMPLICVNDKHPSGISIYKILSAFQHAVLMLFADGRYFYNVKKGRPFKWVSVFKHWEHRFFFPHNPPLSWGLREELINKTFPVILPSGSEGFLAMINYFSEKASSELFTLKYWSDKDDYALYEVNTNDIQLTDFDLYFNPKILQWIAACAVYPELNWGLTLLLGKNLFEGGENMLTQSNINQLLRLDWFTHGRIPEESRHLLIEQWLGDDKNSLFRKANRIIYEQLDKVPGKEKEDTAFKLQLAIHKLLGIDDDKERKKQADEIDKLFKEHDTRPDWVTLKRVEETKIKPFDFVIPDYILERWKLAERKERPPIVDPGPDFKKTFHYSCFISYSSKDERFVEQLNESLQQMGVQTWIDKHESSAGDQFEEQADKAIREMDKFILVLTEESLRSEWVKSEVSKAFEKSEETGKSVVIPISLSSPDRLRKIVMSDGDPDDQVIEKIFSYQMLNFEYWQKEDQYEESLEKLVETLRIKTETEPESEITTSAGKFILVKGGTFKMGSSENDKEALDREKPQHEVKLNDFYIAETPVIQKIWKEVMGKNLSNFTGDDLPVEQVNWYDAVEFCNKLSKKEDKEEYYIIDEKNKDSNNEHTSDVIKWKVDINPNAKGYRLPTEAEWEYAARGGNKSKGYTFAGSNKIDEVAWYDKNSDKKAQPVKGMKPNELGIYDMSGNVNEWCWNWYDEKYYEKCKKEGTVENPQGPDSGSTRVVRGGGWGSGARYCRVAGRVNIYPHYRSGLNISGFRLVFVP